MAGPKFDQAGVGPKQCAPCKDSADIMFFRRLIWLWSRIHRSGLDPADRVRNNEIDFATKFEHWKTEHLPIPSMERPFSGPDPFQRKSGRPWTIPIIDILTPQANPRSGRATPRLMPIRNAAPHGVLRKLGPQAATCRVGLLCRFGLRHLCGLGWAGGVGGGLKSRPEGVAALDACEAQKRVAHATVDPPSRECAGQHMATQTPTHTNKGDERRADSRPSAEQSCMRIPQQLSPLRTPSSQFLVPCRLRGAPAELHDARDDEEADIVHHPHRPVGRSASRAHTCRLASPGGATKVSLL